MENFKVAENIANIGMTAGVMLKEEAIVVEDSTELSQTIVALGSQFEKEFGEKIDGDYIDLIDNFAEKELLKSYAPHDLILKYLSVHTTLSDKRISHARFFLANEEDVKHLEGNVVSIPDRLKSACIKSLELEGYEYVESLNHYDDHILTVEVKKKS